MHSLFFKGVLKRWLYLGPLRNTVLTNKNSLPVSCLWRFWMIWHRNHATFISWKYLLRFFHLKKWQFVFSCPILMYWSKGPVYMYECYSKYTVMSAYVIHQYVYCISKNLINRCRRFWWINFQRMMLLQWQGHKKKKRKGRSIWIPRWLVEIQTTILVNWDKDLWFLFLIL